MEEQSQGKSALPDGEDYQALRNNIHILIVEDQKFPQKVLKTGLDKHLRTTFVETGKEALSIYREQKPSMVLLDLNLPDMEGYKVLQAIRDMDKDAFVVIVTADGSQGSIDRALGLGASGYVVKPVTIPRIDEFVRQYIAAQINGKEEKS